MRALTAVRHNFAIRATTDIFAEANIEQRPPAFRARSVAGESVP
jgi:hypothetical protein